MNVRRHKTDDLPVDVKTHQGSVVNCRTRSGPVIPGGAHKKSQTSLNLFMKLFRTGSIDVVQECRSYFGVELPSCLIKK